MASSYSTSLGIEKMATGDQSGAWGTTSNHNWDILDRISAYAAVALSDAATATLTVREASPGSGTENLQNGMYRVIKFTGSLSQACTITIAPNTTKMFFIVVNATTDAASSGPYSLAFTQGSGANVTVQNGNNAVIYCDGAGSGAVVTDALSDLQIGNDLSLVSDSAVLNMGADNDITITHVADVGLKLKQAGATGDGSPFVLTLQTGELDIAAADVLGQLDFQAPDEAAGTDAILVAAGISAISEGDFSSSSNATKLSFKTAVSEAASEKMFLSSAGNLDVTGDITGATLNADGDTSASDNAAIGYTSAEGLILTGQGSTNDVTIKNDADAAVISVATGTTNVDVVGDLTAGTLNADGDTSAGDNAAVGYTSAEGLVLTGQGSTNDITIKNDADAAVISIPTGTTNVTIAGNLSVTGTATPLNSQSVDYTGVIGDANGTLLHASGSGTDTFTIPANSSVAYVIGTMITFVNESSGNLTIAITSDTMTDTDGNTGSRTLAENGISTAIKTTATTWRISGVGMS